VTAAFRACKLSHVGTELQNDEEEITVHELGHAIRLLGFDPTESELVYMIHSVDANASGKLSLDEFYNLMTNEREATPHSEAETLRRAFEMFDVNGDGVISATELRAGLIGDGDCMRAEEVDEIMAGVMAEKASMKEKEGEGYLAGGRGSPTGSDSLYATAVPVGLDPDGCYISFAEFLRLINPKTRYEGSTDGYSGEHHTTGKPKSVVSIAAAVDEEVEEVEEEEEVPAAPAKAKMGTSPL